MQLQPRMRAKLWTDLTSLLRKTNANQLVHMFVLVTAELPDYEVSKECAVLVQTRV